ncbi:MAG: N-acetylmuramoyl-L-alanine amidase [Rhodocyclaceae bacterium]|jgi:N-acetylmuramoyl-L-alanine amidase
MHLPLPTVVALSGLALLGPLPAGAAEVALDVGHGLVDVGAMSARGRGEHEFNRALAPVVQQALEARGVTVRPINYDGKIRSLSARPEAAQGADLFISLHHDSVPAYELSPWVWQEKRLDYCDKYSGFSLHVSRRNPAPDISGGCASAIGASMRLAGFVPTRHHYPKHPWADEDNAVHWHDNLVVLHRTTLPAVLFEAGVIKHRDEELLLSDPARMARMADAIATGVAACLYAMPR